MKKFTHLAYANANEMIFGRSPYPIRTGFDVAIGDGMVLPEVNFTLPPMHVSNKNLHEILQQYEEIIKSVLSRLNKLQAPGAVIEFEHTPQMTEEVEIAARVTELLIEHMRAAHEKHGLKTALRATVCDLREKERPARMRSGQQTQQVFDAFRVSAEKGAHLLSIESTGGKEVSDQALMEADVQGLLLALGILAPRDMHFLWRNISEIAQAGNAIAAGDTACAFANTAMILADQNYIPNVLAAVVRAMSAVRSLVAYEEGAAGPSKDCAYEGPIIKAITGYPISMEGKSAACAHFSHVGNIAAAVCDLWSNESVQNVKLLSGYAPEVCTEMLAFDCRLMNQALNNGEAALLRKLFVRSDIHASVHALIISPESSVRIAHAILQEKSDFARTRRAGLVACEIIREALASDALALPQREQTYLQMIEEALAGNGDEKKVLSDAGARYVENFLPQEYGL